MKSNHVRVVLIDDDQGDFLMIKNLLEEVLDIHYDLKWIPTFKEGEDELRTQTADVYLIDYHLGGHTGLELIDNMQNVTLTKPMILLTGFGTRELDICAMEKGVSNFMPKERLTSETLERTIRYAVKRAEDEQRLRADVRLRSEKDAAELANQAKSLFLANMTHEIRSPMSAILGFADLALEGETSESDRLKYLEIIKKNGKHLLLLIDDILDLSKIEAGRLEVNNSWSDWRTVIGEIIELLNPTADKKRLKLSFIDDAEIPSEFFTDPQYFRQILFNIIGNAVKFTPSGKVEIIAERSHLNGEVGSLSISVRDTGIGITAADQPRLFQPFTQGSAHSNLRLGGTGLGLDLSRKLAEALGGTLELLESTIGEGSTFALEFHGSLR